MARKSSVLFIKKWGNRIIIVAIILEMFFWPSLENLAGCGMTWICWSLFRKIGLNETIIKEHFFVWLVFLSMSLYRILPLLATLVEFNSIGYNFRVPFDTYLGETVLYLFSALAFYCATRSHNALRKLKSLLYRYGLYDRVSNKTIWILGLMGLAIRFYLMGTHVQIGDVIGKTLAGFLFFQYAPLILFFPSLYSNSQKQNDIVVRNRLATFYFIFIILLAFSTNSRYAILEPFGTFALLFVLSYVQHKTSTRQLINKKYIIYAALAIIFFVPFVSDVSLAMIANRNIRSEVSASELLKSTLNTYLDRDKMELLRRLKEQKGVEGLKEEEWTEIYVSNFALNRYCNLKVTDNTLYHAERVGFNNEVMYNDYWNRVLGLLPMPILKELGINYNKNEIFSRGDLLKSLSLNVPIFASLLVTSHLADGLATFGFFYFPLECLLMYLRFLFLDTFLIIRNNRVQYSILGLITIFSFLAMFRNASGGCDSLGYLLRGYWQDVILFIICFFIIKRISR